VALLRHHNCESTDTRQLQACLKAFRARLESEDEFYSPQGVLQLLGLFQVPSADQVSSQLLPLLVVQAQTHNSKKLLSCLLVADWVHESQHTCRDLNSRPGVPPGLQARTRFAELVSILVNLRESENQRLKLLVLRLNRCAQLSKAKVLRLALNIFDESSALEVAGQSFWGSLIRTALNNLPLLLDCLFTRFKICFHPSISKKLRDDKFYFSYEKPHNSIEQGQFIGPFPDLSQVAGLKEYSLASLQKATRHHQSFASPNLSKTPAAHPNLAITDDWLLSIKHVHEQIRTVFCDSFHFVQACALKVALEVLSQGSSQAHIAPLESLKRYFKETVW